MKRILIITMSSAIALFTSCKKDDPEPVPVPSPVPAASSYTPMKTGSYWVYDVYHIDPSGSQLYLDTDSMYVEADTLINGNTYHKLTGTRFGLPYVSYLRDSSGYLVHHTGKIEFSSTNFSDILNTMVYPSAGVLLVKMESSTAQVTVPAGTFTAYDARGTMYCTIPGYPYSIPRYTHSYFASNVGRVMDVDFYLSDPGTRERRLVRYHIEP